MNDKFLNEAEVAASLRVSKASMARLRRKGQGPAHRIVNARTILYTEAAVIAWLNAGVAAAS